jgi:hypothetical protein
VAWQAGCAVRKRAVGPEFAAGPVSLQTVKFCFFLSVQKLFEVEFDSLIKFEPTK